MAQQYDFGMIGLGVMGRNLLLNLADSGFSSIGLDQDAAKAQALNDEGLNLPVHGTTSIKDFVAALQKPRRIMLLVPAGPIVDNVISDLLPLLDEGDIIIDGGNSHYPDTERRTEGLLVKGIFFVGAGVSGGAQGARLGPSIMPGGPREAWERLRPVLEAVAAKVDGDPCVTYMGRGSAGHYVKMVHNGIEYGLMQLIAEAFDLMRRIGGLGHSDMAKTFSDWNQGRLGGFLIEITAQILAFRDEEDKGYLVDYILDRAKQKGTGKWTSQSAMDFGVPIPTIDAAVTMRGISFLREFRLDLAKLHEDPNQQPKNLPTEGPEFIEQLEKALYFAFILTYAQGMHLLAEASRELKYDLNLADIARIWRGGCIIRAALLERIRQAYAAEPELTNFMVAGDIHTDLKACRDATVEVLRLASERGIPALCLATALHYYDAFRSDQLPLNLVQAQRDYFGSHTYERVDKEGVFHTEWVGTAPGD